jgi:hypothetical protein
MRIFVPEVDEIPYQDGVYVRVFPVMHPYPGWPGGCSYWVIKFTGHYPPVERRAPTSFTVFLMTSVYWAAIAPEGHVPFQASIVKAG